MSITNSNLSKLLARSKQVINEVKKAKLDLTTPTPTLPDKPLLPKSASKLQHPIRKHPIFKLSSSKGFTPHNPNKELRINTLPDYIDCPVESNYETPKFSNQYTVKVERDEGIEGMFTTFGFSKKGRGGGGGRTEKSVRPRGKENREEGERRGNREEGGKQGREKEGKEGREGKEGKKKFLSTLNFGTKKEKEKEKGKANVSSRRFL